MNNKEYNQGLHDYLLPYVTTNKQIRFEEVLNLRTRSLTVVLEDIFKPHNASAVMRTAECMGIQDIHVVEQVNAFNMNPYVLRGSGKWLSLHHYRRRDGLNNVEKCYSRLKKQGYTIVATTPHDAIDYDALELPDKVALVFGSEENGISDYAKNNADHLIKIPMRGFTESFNISVSAAIVLEYYNAQLRKKTRWHLDPVELFELKLEWMKKVVPNIDVHIRRFDSLTGLNQDT